MIRLPRDFKPLLDDLSAVISRPQTSRRLVLFLATAVFVVADRTVSVVMRVLGLIEPVNPSTYHRLFSHRRRPAARLAKVVVCFVINRFTPKF